MKIKIITKQIDAFIFRIQNYFNQNVLLVSTLVAVLIAAYGFELFNLNLTIDEEMHAISSQLGRWIEEGRWGMYLLNRFLIPQPVIPFVPLFTALTFHLLAILLLINSWEVDSEPEKFMVGAIGVAYPGIAYMYTFSTINFGIGIAFFFVALALFVYAKSQGLCRYFSIIPAAVAISIYQGFAVALAVAFLVHFISSEIKNDRNNVNIKNLLTILLIGLLSAATYYVIQKLFLFLALSKIEYVGDYFDINFLLGNFGVATQRLFDSMLLIYSGDSSIYGVEIRMLVAIFILYFASLMFRLMSGNLSLSKKLIITTLCLFLLVLPFAAGFFMRGYLSMRFLVSLPIVLAGVVALGLHGRSRGSKLFAGVLAGVCVFQFVISTNTLFSASALVLQADRLLAGRVLERIADAKAAAGAKDLKYLEVVGYINRTPTRLIPKSETFGASFFEWDQGNAHRIISFLKTLGAEELQALPEKERSELMDSTIPMTIWPDKGSVQVFRDTVVVKFGPYSDVQNQTICAAVKNAKYCD